MSAPEAVARPRLEEMRALRESVGLARRSDLEAVELTGADRVRFLQNLMTCDVGSLAPGRWVRGFLTQVKGGVLADATVAALDGRFLLLLAPGRTESVLEHFARYRVVERVAAERSTESVAWLELRGERAPELLARLGLPVPGNGGNLEISLAGRSGLLLAAMARTGPRFLLGTSEEALSGWIDALEGTGAELGLVELAADALTLARIQAGELVWGVDYSEENFPQETGEEEAVSYAKGCYLGQEVVARIHYRGGVQRLPRRLRFEAGSAPEPGAELLLDGRAVGRATTLAVDPASGRVVGLALVHRRAAEAGTVLTTAAGEGAEVLPVADAGGPGSDRAPEEPRARG